MNVDEVRTYLCLYIYELLFAHIICLLLLHVREVFAKGAPGGVIAGSMYGRAAEVSSLLTLESLYRLMYFLIIFIVNVFFCRLGCTICN